MQAFTLEAVPTGTVTTFAGSGAAGSGNGTGTAASFRNPEGMAIDPRAANEVPSTKGSLGG